MTAVPVSGTEAFHMANACRRHGLPVPGEAWQLKYFSAAWPEDGEAAAGRQARSMQAIANALC